MRVLQLPLETHRRMTAGEAHEHERLLRGLNDVQRKLAWHAGMWRAGRFKMPLPEARQYVQALPLALSREHARIDGGAQPPYPKLTKSYVMQLTDTPPPGADA